MSEDAAARVRLTAERKRGGVRWLTRLDPGTAEAYTAAVVPLVPPIEQALSSGVVANRVLGVGVDPAAIHLESWTAARARFRRRVERSATAAGAALVTDVRDCYGSIAPLALGLALEAIGVSPADAAPALRILERLGALGVRGLPIGPEPSAVLANAVLSTADRALARTGFTHVRWVDDVIVFTPDRAAAEHALEVLQDAVARIGLSLAAEKTCVMLDPARVRGGGPGQLSGLTRRPSASAG